MSREDAEMILKAAKEMEKIWTSTDADGSVFDAACRPILKIMCREISKQKKRLGGSFAVAHAVVTRYLLITGRQLFLLHIYESYNVYCREPSANETFSGRVAMSAGRRWDQTTWSSW